MFRLNVLVVFVTSNGGRVVLINSFFPCHFFLDLAFSYERINTHRISNVLIILYACAERRGEGLAERKKEDLCAERSKGRGFIWREEKRSKVYVCRGK